eukprot:TRINITY_DN1454_c0_g1_i1.p1 TRINITY_DN1454_c0_g1~~TRINITY_DN1454_c0_g1_i1.p1  ORF type:complete len:510 (+),score=136.03 TRINITY_DN1454_c0_g1_i1:67-1596(+)
MTHMNRRGDVAAVFYLLVVLSILSFSCVVKAQPSGARTVISQNLLNAAVAAEVPPLIQKFNGYTLPDLSGENQEGPIDVHWTLTDITLANPTVGALGVAFVAPANGEVAVENAAIVVNAAWSYYFWTGWKNSDHGTVQLTFSSVDVGIEVQASDVGGKGYITLVTDGLDLGDCSISLSGGASWLYDLFKSVIVDEIKNGASQAFNSGVPQAIAEANTKLQAQPMYKDEAEAGVGLNYMLTEQPAVTTAGYLTVSTMSAFYPISVGPSAQPPFEPSVTLPYIFNSQDIQVFLSDYTINSIGWALFEEGKLNYTIKPSDLPAADQKYLNTSEYKLLLSRLYRDFPNMEINLKVECETWPDIKISGSDGISFYLPVPIAWEVVQPNGTLAEAFVIGVDVYSQVTGYFNTSTNTIQGSLGDLSINITLVSSNIGTFSVGLISSIVNIAIKSTIIPKINDILQKGYPLPALPDGVTLQNPTLVVNDGYVSVGVDLAFAGEPLKTEKESRIHIQQ